MDLNLLRVFEGNYRFRNLTQAAEQLRGTQSALSHSLGKLRRAFHNELLIRRGRSMEPTVRAAALHSPVPRMMETLSTKVLSMSQFDPSTAQREFSMAMINMSELVFLPPFMNRLEKQAPRCTLRTRRMPWEIGARGGGGPRAAGMIADICRFTS
ncbi:hypothetical protein BZM27_16065 [Paraburkholderia steynii]|uniref:HTH lysR-type domain-containing protein n=1 Tax=Paraburkholderia steynii TaxID=1245441 RepID=A0A4R0XBX7_9BURK|nr:hypothetical protein BZM27_16065 [Paraburkholderia steynii]